MSVSPRIPAARIERIRRLVEQSGVVSLRQVMEELGVSEMTVRRDFAALEEMGVVQRTRGGVMAVDRVFVPYAERQALESEAKAAIGALAAGFVEDGDTVFLGAGTTCLAVARALTECESVTVITTSIPALTTLMTNPALTVISTGGSVNSLGNDLTGPLAEATLSRVRAAKAFVGASGMSAEGIFNSSVARASIDGAMIAAAVETFVVADHTKIGRAALSLVAGLERIAYLVTDEPPAQEATMWLSSADIDVRTAS
jgi:DeoR/GlpR family transcriptional regulator of sugar metabolism